MLWLTEGRGRVQALTTVMITMVPTGGRFGPPRRSSRARRPARESQSADRLVTQPTARTEERSARRGSILRRQARKSPRVVNLHRIGRSAYSCGRADDHCVPCRVGGLYHLVLLRARTVCHVLATSLIGDVAAALGEHVLATLDEHCDYFRRRGRGQADRVNPPCLP